MERKKKNMDGKKISATLGALVLAAMLMLVVLPAPAAGAETVAEGDLEVVSLALPPIAFADMPLFVGVLLQNGEDDDIWIYNITVYIEDDDDVNIKSKEIKDIGQDWWEEELDEDDGRLYTTSIVIPDYANGDDIGGDSYDVYARVYYCMADEDAIIAEAKAGTYTNLTYEDSDEQSVYVLDPFNDFFADLEISFPFFGGDDDDDDFFGLFGSEPEPYTATTGASPEGDAVVVEETPSYEASDTDKSSMNWDTVTSLPIF